MTQTSGQPTRLSVLNALTIYECWICKDKLKLDYFKRHFKKFHANFLQFLSVRCGGVSLNDTLDKCFDLAQSSVDESLLGELKADFVREHKDKFVYPSLYLGDDFETSTYAEQYVDSDLKSCSNSQRNITSGKCETLHQENCCNNFQEKLISVEEIPTDEDTEVIGIRDTESFDPNAEQDRSIPLGLNLIQIHDQDTQVKKNCDHASCSVCTASVSFMMSNMRILGDIINRHCKCHTTKCCCQNMIAQYFSGREEIVKTSKRAFNENFFCKDSKGQQFYLCRLCNELQNDPNLRYKVASCTLQDEENHETGRLKYKRRMKYHLGSSRHRTSVLRKYIQHMKEINERDVSEFSPQDEIVDEESSASKYKDYLKPHVIKDEESIHCFNADGIKTEIVDNGDIVISDMNEFDVYQNEGSCSPRVLSVSVSDVDTPGIIKEEHVYDEAMGFDENNPCELNTIEIVEETVETSTDNVIHLRMVQWDDSVFPVRAIQHVDSQNLLSKEVQFRSTAGVLPGRQSKIPMPKIYACNACPKTFVTKPQLRNHYNSAHENLKPFECVTCGRSYSTRMQLKSHEVSHITTKTLQCSKCPKMFAHPTRLKQHEKLHDPELKRKVYLPVKGSFQCEVCNKIFAYKNTLKAHMRIHLGDKRYACEECGDRFMHMIQLIRHKTIHSLQQHKCDQCGKAFKDVYMLRKHFNVHAKTRPYICKICSKGFTSNTILKNHIRRHLGETPFQCEHCDMAFSDSSYLAHHRRKMHGPREPIIL